MWLLCLKMKALIWGCLGQMAHRRQIAQWAGTRTTHPGGTGFEPRRGLMMGISPEDCSLVLFVLFGRGWPEPNDLDSERAEADWTPSLGT